MGHVGVGKGADARGGHQFAEFLDPDQVLGLLGLLLVGGVFRAAPAAGHWLDVDSWEAGPRVAAIAIVIESSSRRTIQGGVGRRLAPSKPTCVRQTITLELCSSWDTIARAV
jgi:hypothetical protein